MERSQGSLTITEHPTDPIEIDCQKCGRNGRYRKATLIENYGSETVLPYLLAMLASDCEFREKMTAIEELFMPRKPNYNFERQERDRLKAEKRLQRRRQKPKNPN